MIYLIKHKKTISQANEVLVEAQKVAENMYGVLKSWIYLKIIRDRRQDPVLSKVSAVRNLS